MTDTEKIVSTLKVLETLLPVTAATEKQLEAESHRLGKLLRSVGLQYYEYKPQGSSHTRQVSISWRGVFFHWIGGGGDAFSCRYDADELAEIIMELPDALAQWSKEKGDERSKYAAALDKARDVVGPKTVTHGKIA